MYGTPLIRPSGTFSPRGGEKANHPCLPSPRDREKANRPCLPSPRVSGERVAEGRVRGRVIEVLLVVLLLFVACRNKHEAPPKVAAVATQAQSDWEADTLPSRDAYAGSAKCGECHEKKHDRWQRDWHAKALAEATPESVVGRFSGAHYKGESSEAWMERRGDAYFMRTRGATPEVKDFPISWVIGGKRMQDTVTAFDDGRWQVLPVYFHVTGGGAWVDYNESKQGKVGPDHPYYWTNFRRTSNKECLECHATGVDVRYDAKTHQWSTTMADAGVACEACHGPGARHAETKEKSDIVRPDHIDKKLAFAICGRCHGPHEPAFPILDWKDQFRPGEKYDDRYQALVVVDGKERSGEFFADGRPSSSSFEYQAVLQSRCSMRGGATCLSCHTAPHDDHHENDLKERNPDATCRTCHAAVFAKGEAHTHHQSVSCVGCHMPKVLSGVLDHFPDHALDVPNPENTVRHGVPNACGVCHADKKPADLAQTMSRWWPDAAARQARRTRLADAIDEKTSAQSLPALMAVVRDRDEAPTLRGAAALLLGQRFPREASATLVPLLYDPDPLVRSRFIEALGYAQARDAADAIAPFASDSPLPVRQMAALVLSSFGDARGLAACRLLMNVPKTSKLVRPHVALAIDAANHNDLDTAERELKTAVAEVPYLTDALVMLADIRMRRHDPAGAKEYLEEALRFNPQHRGANGRLAAMR